MKPCARRLWVASLAFLGALGLPPREAQARVIKHSFALPDANRRAADAFVRPCIAAGQMPGAAHPGGTIFLGYVAAGAPHVTVTEWDLATGSPLQSIETPIGPTARTLAMVRAGSWLHLVGSDKFGGTLGYVRLTTALHIEEAVSIGNGYGPTIATDGNLVAVAWSVSIDASGEEQSWRLATMTASGDHLKLATLVQDVGADIDRSTPDPLAVLDGKVYALVLDGPHPYWDLEGYLLRLDADGRLEKRQRLFFTPVFAHLWAVGDHLVTFDGCSGGRSSKELSSDGDDLLNPYATKHDCPLFPLAADRTGRVVTGHGDVLTPTMKIETHFADVASDFQWTVPAWNGATPVLVVVNQKGAARLSWAELSPGRDP